ncbi:MAG: hypothetical protein K2R98_03940 [Gemmataceae bacterium]|nr:hypothetical protein [Gemmataceae bacterium]
MNDRALDIPWVDSNLFWENFGKLPEEEYWKFAEQFVGVSLDGTRILASGVDEQEMEARLREMGIDPSRVVGMYIPPPGASIL